MKNEIKSADDLAIELYAAKPDCDELYWVYSYAMTDGSTYVKILDDKSDWWYRVSGESIEELDCIPSGLE
jgi:hypothetical protein